MRVLVTGATGYVGSRIIPLLLEQHYEVVAALRSREKARDFPWADRVTVVEMDAENREQVTQAVADVDVAYYLLHSMAGDGFADKDRELATTFGQCAAETGVTRIVYLGGLVPETHDLSPHLASRLEVEKILQKSGVPVTISVRAGILVGGGSTSFELIRRLVERMPIIPLPSFMNALIQPVSIADAAEILAQASRYPAESAIINAVGSDVLKYSDLVRTYARVAGLKRLFIPVPSVPYSWVSEPGALISGLPRPVVKALVPSMGEELIAQADVAWDLIEPLHGLEPVAIDAAMNRSLRSHGETSEARDIHDLLLSDPEWAGGEVVIKRGKVRGLGRSLWSRVAGTHR